MPSLRTIFFSLLAASFSSTAIAEHLRAVWSSGGFSTVSGPSGNENGHYTGFAILNDDGVAIYTKAYPDNHAPCYSTGSGREFTLGNDPCWNQVRKFRCRCSLAGNPEACEVKDKDGNSLGTSEGKTDTTFIGIAIAQDATCVVEFDTEDGETCPKDEENNLGVTEG
ncbi:hypothetical protein NW762_009165 [Fusarium torreyae]|uniref:Uncharacterized protein n=1 Tax=Fusarium torreyae TaxID=1237075 RepID=A0A9W8RVM2_9HYPO|nr:hypothetical protein NW762_009165 [Fusarium torreyae]